MTDDTKKPAKSDEYKNALTAHQRTTIDAKTQQMLNKPAQTKSSQLSDDDNAFLDDLIKQVDAGDIDLYKPSSILNEDIYDKLSGENKARTDLFLNSTLFVIRQVYDFYQSDYSNESDMMINMVQELRHKKETLEEEIGDVLKI